MKRAYKNLKKLVIILFWFIITLILGLIVCTFLLISAAGLKPRDRPIEAQGERINNLLDCKRMLQQENARDPNIYYNYAYYLKSGHCPPPSKLQNLEEIQKSFCKEVIQKAPDLYQRYVDGRICPNLSK